MKNIAITHLDKEDLKQRKRDLEEKQAMYIELAKLNLINGNHKQYDSAIDSYSRIGVSLIKIKERLTL